MWTRHIASRYKDNLSTFRTSNKQDGLIFDAVRRVWQEKWAEESYIQKRSIASKNWLTKKADPGTGPSKHTGGSRSMLEHK